MIYIEHGQMVSENPNLRVDIPSGDYQDADLVDFYDISKPRSIVGSFQAQYVRYGSVVYRFNAPEELGAEILKIDSESTHAAAIYFKMTKDLRDQLNAGAMSPSILDEMKEPSTLPSKALPPIQKKKLHKDKSVKLNVDISSTTPSVIPALITEEGEQILLEGIPDSSSELKNIPSNGEEAVREKIIVYAKEKIEKIARNSFTKIAKASRASKRSSI